MFVMFCLSTCLCFALTFVFVFTILNLYYARSISSYAQTNSIKSVMLGTVWDDIKFEDINSIGTIWGWMGNVSFF